MTVADATPSHMAIASPADSASSVQAVVGMPWFGAARVRVYVTGHGSPRSTHAAASCDAARQRMTEDDLEREFAIWDDVAYDWAMHTAAATAEIWPDY